MELPCCTLYRIRAVNLISFVNACLSRLCGCLVEKRPIYFFSPLQLVVQYSHGLYFMTLQSAIVRIHSFYSWLPFRHTILLHIHTKCRSYCYGCLFAIAPRWNSKSIARNLRLNIPTFLLVFRFFFIKSTTFVIFLLRKFALFPFYYFYAGALPCIK